MSDTVAVPELETPNLRLRAWLEADAAVLHEAFGDAETMRFWDSPPARDVVETGERIRGSRAVNPRFHAAFAIMRREDGAVVGMINCHARQPAMRRCGDWSWDGFYFRLGNGWRCQCKSRLIKSFGSSGQHLSTV